MNRHLNTNPHQYRLSIDTKAKLAIGDCLRHGTTRIAKPEPAWDHDMSPTGKLVPEGLFEPGHDRLTIDDGLSIKTSDMIAGCLERW